MWKSSELVVPSSHQQQTLSRHRSGDLSDAWLRTLKEATACLRDGRPPTTEELDHCLAYLNLLEAVLLTKEGKWDRPPNKEPPLWEPVGQEKGTTASNERTSRPVHQSVHRTTGESNRFATFQDDSEDDSLSSRSVNDAEEEEGEAGDRPVLNREEDPPNAAVPYTEGMDMRRLMIRIMNAQSDVWAAKALLFRKQSPPAWTQGAEQYAHCLHRIHSALILADSEISKWISANAVNSRTLLLLTEDADIVEVAVQTMTTNRGNYLAAALDQEAYLMRKLQPQWQSRDDIKERMGDRWFQNPHPKQDYAKMRAEYEQQLADVRKAVQCLEQLDTTEAEQSSKLLKAKLLGSSSSSSQQQQQQYRTTPSSTSQRYNAQRPVDLTRRVDMNLYPDPTLFGWAFTGSSGVTEFFEKDGVKLDWYFTTATIKTSLDHPVQARTQLFGARVDPDTYRAILENPRAHTGNRYHRK